MCFPAVAAAIPAAISSITTALAPYATAIQAAGTVASTVGTVYAAQSAAAQGEYNAKVAEVNASTARAEGNAQAEAIRDRYRRAKGEAMGAAAASGVDPTQGSAALVINEDLGKNRWLDEMTAVWNKDTEAQASMNQAADLKAQAKSTRRGGYLSGGATLMTGLSRMNRIT